MNARAYSSATVAMTGPAQLSYSHGASPHPLLGETIGDNLRRVAAAYPDAEAVVDVPTGRRWTYAQFDADTDTLARGLIASGIEAGERVGIWSPNCAEWVLLQYATAKAGVVLVNINPAYRSHELGYALRQSGVRHAGQCRVVQDEQLPGDGRGGPRRPGRAGAGHLPGLTRSGTRCWRPGQCKGSGAADPLAAREAGLAFDDPINIQYTSGTTGFPKGATLSHHNILNNGFFIGEGCRYTEADRVCIPVPFYHCFGMVLGNLACTTHGACIVIPAPAFDPARHAAGGAGRAVHVAVRRARPCSSPNWPCPTSPATTCPAAHRDHGRLAVPGRGDEAGHQRDAHDRGDHLLRDDGDVPGVHPDPGGRRHGPAGGHRGPGAPARRGQDHRPGDRAGACRAGRPGNCAPAGTR